MQTDVQHHLQEEGNILQKMDKSGGDGLTIDPLTSPLLSPAKS